MVILVLSFPLLLHRHVHVHLIIKLTNIILGSQLLIEKVHTRLSGGVDIYTLVGWKFTLVPLQSITQHLADGLLTLKKSRMAKWRKPTRMTKKRTAKMVLIMPLVHLLLVRDEGRGYDVGHEQEIDNKVEDQQRDRVLVLPQKTTPIHWL